MRFEQRVLHQTIDISELVNDFRQGTYTFAYDSTEYLYIGSIVPFNNLYFEIGTANTIPAIPSVEIWWGKEWSAAVDLYDQTNGLFNSGRLVWNTELDRGWLCERRSSDVTGLTGTNIFNMFWLRVKWDVTFDPATTIKYIGQKFSSDDVLASYYPDLLLPALLDQYEAGKTTWDEQHYMAAELIVMDLKKRGVIVGRGQLLDYKDFEQSSCHKLAEIVYTAFGPSYFEQRAEARKYYDEQLSLPFAKIDRMLDGRIDPVERVLSTRFMTR